VWQKSALHLYHGLHPVADHFHDPCRGYVILWMDVPVRLWQFCRAKVCIAAHRLVVDAYELAYRLRPGPQTDLYTGVIRGEYGAQVLSPMKATSVWGSPDADSDLGCSSFQDSDETLRLGQRRSGLRDISTPTARQRVHHPDQVQHLKVFPTDLRSVGP